MVQNRQLALLRASGSLHPPIASWGPDATRNLQGSEFCGIIFTSNRTWRQFEFQIKLR